MYYYLLNKWHKEVIEISAENSEYLPIFDSMKIKYYDYFPYEEAGYEDPYAFLEEYKLIKFLPDPTNMGMSIEVEE